VLLAALVAAAIGAVLLPPDSFAAKALPLMPPSGSHPFGTDDLGRDVFYGVIQGARTSLFVGFAAAAVATMLGLVVGGFSGIRGGVLDAALMRLAEFVQALPRFFLLIVVVSLFETRLVLLTAVIGLTSWPAVARVFRAQVLSMAERDFIVAARSVGARDLRILALHALPVAMPVIAAQVSYQAGGAILTEAALSFLGLGDPNAVSWGALLGSAQHFVREAWWISLFPGAAITLTVLACNLLAEGTAEGPPVFVSAATASRQAASSP
jgi:peptide/nickel transport system permease protein